MSRFGTKYGVDLKLEDSLAAALVDQNPGGQKVPMGGMWLCTFRIALGP
jgi:acetyl-CoA acyltransferase 2